MSSLPTPLRKQLAATVQRARIVAEDGARNALQALAVHEADPYQHMDEAQRQLRRRLRAQARQLGDAESRTKRGMLDISLLMEKLAYDQWHRLLFARYLLENNLLISPEHGVAVTLDDCEELAPSEGLKDAWAVAARYAAKELPEIFRADDPAGAVELSVNDRKAMVALVTGLPVEVFTASDSLGWCYQFWQAEKKDRVNDAGGKIGAEELPSVTQLFTEDYMVDFLLDNTLGAWHAGKVLAENPKLAEGAQSEDEVRQAVALPGCSWSYLRCVKGVGGKWTPAAGTFDGWPRTAATIKALDPCMGSGHFAVAIFERLVALRAAEEKLGDEQAVAAVIRENLFGLEIDPRCTQIAAFNLALAAWRRAGHCRLPAMNLACAGLAPNAREIEWLAIAGDDEKLKNGMRRLYRLFKDAPVLGSLIDPRTSDGDLLEAGFQELQPVLERALAQDARNEKSYEIAVTARGIAKAAELLSGQFTLVATNVPYLGRGKQCDALQFHCEREFPSSKSDLATCFIERSLKFASPGGSIAVVAPQNWLFLGSYKRLRASLLRSQKWEFVIRLGPKGFQTPMWDFNVMLFGATRALPSAENVFLGLDVTHAGSALAKADALIAGAPLDVAQDKQLLNADARITLGQVSASPPLRDQAETGTGLQTFDRPRFIAGFWEVPITDDGWLPLQSTPKVGSPWSGMEEAVRWERGVGGLYELMEVKARFEGYTSGIWKAGSQFWGRRGVLHGVMGKLPYAHYLGGPYDTNAAVLIPKHAESLPAIVAFSASGEFATEVRRLDQKLMVTNATFTKVPFDFEHWQRVAKEQYPSGLPAPHSSDPTQWLFDGHPADSEQPLHVAVARLLGYRWPRQTGTSFPDCPALEPDGLETLADDDGIVPISPIKGEGAAAERLRELLVRGYGKEWNATLQDQLLSQVGYAGASLEDWLRNGFFEQHCALFHQRPFIWHIWDGRKDGFSALVNYHRLTHANLEKLTFAYLGDWIRRQQAAVEAGEAGSDARLQAAKQLQARLKLILDGEPPFDFFVRWKPLAQQAIGWHPDINDGVRMNIRPFMAQDIAGGKKGAGILRSKPNVKWEKDRGTEPVRDKKAYPWFWGWDGQAVDFAGVGTKPDGNRWNACHFTNAFKQRARDSEGNK
ncbi:N-6 DNA methylase [Gemmatimonas sp.]|uniref:Eco57I restriction-modification methylase domain-containing protein n=1 Tax=Gemmatimonas sp. TaxID=1962908 RepID=UPI003341CC99